MEWISANKEKPAATLPAVIGAVAILVLIIGGLAWANFAPRHEANLQKRAIAPEEQQKVDQQTAWLKQKAKESGGDWQKLSPEDQQQLKMIAKDEYGSILRFYAQAK